VIWQGWQQLYQSKLVTAHDAIARRLKSGSRIFVGNGCGTPQHLVQALASSLRQSVDVEVIYSIAFGHESISASRHPSHDEYRLPE